MLEKNRLSRIKVQIFCRVDDGDPYSFFSRECCHKEINMYLINVVATHKLEQRNI